jgi:hypothetical protein
VRKKRLHQGRIGFHWDTLKSSKQLWALALDVSKCGIDLNCGVNTDNGSLIKGIHMYSWTPGSRESWILYMFLGKDTRMIQIFSPNFFITISKASWFFVDRGPIIGSWALGPSGRCQGQTSGRLNVLGANHGY